MNVSEKQQETFAKWQWEYAYAIVPGDRVLNLGFVKEINFDSPAAKMFKAGWDSACKFISNRALSEVVLYQE